ncbi:MAG: hypothetical protein ACTSR9_19245, partial [Candidatus Thorarchaeota archaeon]
MPFTPYHFGPGLLLGVALFPFIDISTVMVASVILDIEPILVLMLNLPLPLHGFLHSYLGATAIAFILTFALYPMIGFLNKIVALFGLHQESSLRHILPASLIGTYAHVFLDSFIYLEMNPFFPLIGNPFIGVIPAIFVYSSCIYLGL